MALTPAEKQRRYRQRVNARAQNHPDVVEAALLQDVERAERGELSHELSKMATKIRTGSDR